MPATPTPRRPSDDWQAVWHVTASGDEPSSGGLVHFRVTATVDVREPVRVERRFTNAEDIVASLREWLTEVAPLT